MLNDTDGTTLLVEFQSALSPDQAVAIKTLANCAREFDPRYFEHRTFEIGGNDVTFLNILWQLFLPQVAATLQKMAELAKLIGTPWNILRREPWDCKLQST